MPEAELNSFVFFFFFLVSSVSCCCFHARRRCPAAKTSMTLIVSDVNSERPQCCQASALGTWSTDELELFGLWSRFSRACSEKIWMHTQQANAEYPEHPAAAPMLRSASTLSTTLKQKCFSPKKRRRVFFFFLYFYFFSPSGALNSSLLG